MKWKNLLKNIQSRLMAFLQDENLSRRFFALLLAVILWSLAVGEGRVITSEKDLNIKVEIKNLPEDLALITEPEHIRVRVRGLSPLLNTAERETVASVDLQNAIEGEGTYGVEVTLPPGLEIISVTPRWIRLTTERILEEQFTVSIALLGLPPGQGIESLTPEPDTVLVRAPRSTLESVTQVVAYVSLGGSATHLEGNFPVRAVDDRGRTLDGEVEPEQVKVIIQQVIQKFEYELPVVPHFSGELADNLELTILEVKPEIFPVVIHSDLEPAKQILTETIYVEELDVGTQSIEKRLVLPEQVQPLKPATAVVTLQVTEKELEISLPEDIEEDLEQESESSSEGD